MGTTIDDEIRGRPNATLPYAHAAGYVEADGVDLVAAADIDEEQLEAARDRYDIPRGYADYREMIETEEPDIVSVATRPGTHAEMVRFAAEAGVPAIYCEKPLCQSMAEADDLVEVCQEHDVAFNLGVNRRYIPLYRTAREMVEDGEVGSRQAIIAQVGAGAALWGHSHAADMLLFLAGDADVEYVQAEADFDESDVDEDDENRLLRDPAISMGFVRFEDGTRGYLTQAGGYEFEVDGEAGKIRTINNGQTATLRQEAGEWDLLEEASFPEVEAKSGTVGCIEELVAALDGKGTTSAPIEVAAAGQEICMGWLASHRRDGARVEVPLDEEARQLRVDPAPESAIDPGE
jgi:predicted dehydrogenase